MPARQLWAFLTGEDLEELIAAIAQREPGLVVSRGRYFKGDARALLEDPAKLERRESLPQERRVYLFHRKHSDAVVAHEQPAGPFAGWKQIDEERSDCIVVRVKEAGTGKLEPAQIYAHVTYWRAADKERKRPMFSIWVGQTMKWLSARLPSTAVKFMRAGPQAQAKARAGELELTYLYRKIEAG